VYDYAKVQLKTDEIVIVGRSIGTGVAARLAAQHPPKILILETPYYSFPDLVNTIYPAVPSALIRYRLDTAHWIGSLNSPIHLIHGDQDPLIPFSSSERLKALNPRVELHTITGAVHNNISEFELYHRALKSIFHSQ
jgi:pimeloyl-ACP methyl ester carboxylesterase